MGVGTRPELEPFVGGLSWERTGGVNRTGVNTLEWVRLADSCEPWAVRGTVLGTWNLALGWFQAGDMLPCV